MSEAADRRLCRRDEIRDGGTRLFEAPGDGPDLFLVRKGEAVYAYLNDCPHWGLPLDVFPGRLLNRVTGDIQCANHGARFDVESGHCTFGPCLGDSLTPVPIEVRDGTIWQTGPVEP